MPRMRWEARGKKGWRVDHRDAFATVFYHPERRSQASTPYHWKVVARHEVLGVLPVRIGEGWTRTGSEAKGTAERVLRAFEKGV